MPVSTSRKVSGGARPTRAVSTCLSMVMVTGDKQGSDDIAGDEQRGSWRLERNCLKERVHRHF